MPPPMQESGWVQWQHAAASPPPARLHQHFQDIASGTNCGVPPTHALTVWVLAMQRLLRLFGVQSSGLASVQLLRLDEPAYLV